MLQSSNSGGCETHLVFSTYLIRSISMAVKKTSKADMRFHAQAFLKREWTQTLCSTLTGNTQPDTFHFLHQTTLGSTNFFSKAFTQASVERKTLYDNGIPFML